MEKLASHVKALIKESEHPVSRWYWHKIAALSETLESEVDKLNCRRLSHFCSICLTNNNSTEPYGPIARSANGQRSQSVEDLDSNDLHFISEITSKIGDAELIGKISDIIYIKTKDARQALVALSKYSELSKMLLDLRLTYDAAPFVQRAIELSNRLNQFDNYLSELANLVIEQGEVASKEVFSEIKIDFNIYQSFLECKGANCARFAWTCELLAGSHILNLDIMSKESFLTLAAKYHKKNRDDKNSNRCILELAAMLEAAAEAQTESSQRTFLYFKSLSLYRSIPGNTEKVERIHSLALESQKSLPNYLAKISSPEIDITDQVNAAREHVKSERFIESLVKLSRVAPIPDYSKIREQVISNASEFPLMGLISKNIIDEKGKTVAKARPILPSLVSGKPDEEALWQAIVSEVNLTRNIDCDGLILPALYQLREDHYFNFKDILPVLRGNPFVEHDKEIIVAKGIYYGLCMQWVESMHILIPQVESSFRHVLESNGVVTSKYDDQGIQESRTLSYLLGHEKLIEIFGEDLMKDFKSILEEKSGPNIRNLLSHGLMSYGRLMSYESVYCWWLCTKYFLLPVVLETKTKK